MPYPRNTKRWNIGDLVIHAADAKKAYMLMRVIGYDAETDECKTRYLRAGSNFDPVWAKRVCHNDIAYLLNPTDFGIDLSKWWKEAAQ